jgi:quinol monooxygenase YgiN
MDGDRVTGRRPFFIGCDLRAIDAALTLRRDAGDVFFPQPVVQEVPAMYARCITAHVHPDRVDDAIAVYQDSIIPAARQQPGFVSAMLLTDRSMGRATSVTVWQDEAARTAADTSGFLREQIGKLAPMFLAAPTRELLDVGACS